MSTSCNARDGPELRSTEGIDSLHLELSVNYADLKRLCNEEKLKFIREKNKSHSSKQFSSSSWWESE